MLHVIDDKILTVLSDSVIAMIDDNIGVIKKCRGCVKAGNKLIIEANNVFTQINIDSYKDVYVYKSTMTYTQL